MKIKQLLPYTILYSIATLGVLFARIGDVVLLEFLAKPSLMIILALFFWVNVKEEKRKPIFIKCILAALFFSWLGDVFLMYQEAAPICFLYGLGAFLVAHIAYILAFTRTNKTGKGNIITKNIWILLPFIAYELILLYFIKDNLGEMKLPVIIYATVISGMAIAALYRYGKVSSQSFNLVMSGALLFVVSDSIIAINKFAHPFASAGFMIMLTYCLAQYLIVMGCLRQLQEKV